MSDQDDMRSPHEVDVDAERFLDGEEEHGVESAVERPPEGSIPDIVDQHTDVPDDDEY